jgi:ribosomal protein L37AE/L43A
LEKSKRESQKGKIKKGKKRMDLPPCRSCGQLKVFSPARIRQHIWICTPCANRARDDNPELYLARKLAEYLRRRGIHSPYPGVEFVREVVQKSGIKDHAQLRHMCIVMTDADSIQQRVFLPEDAKLVSSHDSYAMAKKMSLQDARS